MTFKKAILVVHRWLGLTSGIVVFIVCITGCIFCFQDEIQDAMHSYRTVKVEDRPYVSPTFIKKTALTKFPGATADFLYYYGKDRPAGTYVVTKKGPLYVFLNPYSGALTKVVDPELNFFIIVENIHLYLLLPANIGRWVIGISVIIFVAMMITGLILWWPKRKTDRKRCFTIKWNGRWRRINYDLHNVLGFYATSIAVILAITGLAIAFVPVSDAIYTTANLGKTYAAEKEEPKSDSTKLGFKPTVPVIDKALLHMQQHSPNAEMLLIYDDPAASGPTEAFAYAKTNHYYKSDVYYFDKYTGKLLGTMPHAAKSAGMKMNAMNYDMHVGQILGLPGKIIAFIVSLICASLPITGFIIWFGRRNKSKSNKTKQVVHRRVHKQQLVIKS